ncbi:hypothetical protein NL676_013483 [Syzygium grande]|nr:hypothetical protein NL676_013483 [Syzygium grande]
MENGQRKWRNARSQERRNARGFNASSSSTFAALHDKGGGGEQRKKRARVGYIEEDPMRMHIPLSKIRPDFFIPQHNLSLSRFFFPSKRGTQRLATTRPSLDSSAPSSTISAPATEATGGHHKAERVAATGVVVPGSGIIQAAEIEGVENQGREEERAVIFEGEERGVSSWTANRGRRMASALRGHGDGVAQDAIFFFFLGV